MPPAAAIGGMAVLGAVAGSQKDKSSQRTESGMNLSPASSQELAGQQTMMDSFNWLKDAVDSGPGQSDVSAAYGSQKRLADMLDEFSKGGFAPTASDISQSNDLAAKLFAGRANALTQSFEDQLQGYNKSAAIMGRDPNDPVFRAKLAFQQSRDQQQLADDQGTWATQYAMNNPFQRLGFAQQRAGVLGGLATQAMANRQALASMGSGIMADERNFRIQTADKWGTSTQESGGGLKGALNGALAGAGAGFGIASSMGGFGGGAPAASTPAPFVGPEISPQIFSQRQQMAFVGPMQPAPTRWSAASSMMGKW